MAKPRLAPSVFARHPLTAAIIPATTPDPTIIAVAAVPPTLGLIGLCDLLIATAGARLRR